MDSRFIIMVTVTSRLVMTSQKVTDKRQGVSIGYCVYKGNQYLPGEMWEDGCDYDCVCDDARYGHYKCVEKCFKYTNLPQPFCYLVPDPGYSCCKIPFCNFTSPSKGFTGYASLQPSTNRPVQTTPIATPAPLGYCTYKGKQYLPGETWEDGCDYNCVCDDASFGHYKCVENFTGHASINPSTHRPEQTTPVTTPDRHKTCFSCLGAKDIKCTVKKECKPNEFCEEVKAFLLTDLRKRKDEIVVWNRCCEGSNCNKHYDTSGVEQYYGLKCPQCGHVDTPGMCKEFAICDTGQDCFAGQYWDQHGRIAYRLDCDNSTLCPASNQIPLIGRRDSRQHARGLSYTWTHCCSGDHCTLDACNKHACVSSTTPSPNDASWE